MSAMVSVPKALLLEVLDTALSDSRAVEGEYGVDAEDRAQYAAERAKIEELRRHARLNLAVPAPAYGWWRKKPGCFVCRRRFPTVTDYRQHYLREHRPEESAQ
jgi:hypothetical protein